MPLIRRNTLYVVLTLALAAGLIAIKPHIPPSPERESSAPAVVLVADLREADSPNDTCARIIQVVREAHRKGVSVTELMPNSDSALLKKHPVVVLPTVMVLDRDGRELSRFEGESAATLDAINAKLKELQSQKR